jgi:uncharacterized hydantoinase/oxoprolinase family protein
MSVLTLDIGGAYLKAADGLGYADSQYFPLWKQPDGLAEALRRVVDEAPPADRLVATMTGELADCYNTKVEGVSAILAALAKVADRRELGIYLTDGTIVQCTVAQSRPIEAAAANWHALARFAARYLRRGGGLLLSFRSSATRLRPRAVPIPSACCTVNWSIQALNAAPSAPWRRPSPGADSNARPLTKCLPRHGTRI